MKNRDDSPLRTIYFAIFGVGGEKRKMFSAPYTSYTGSKQILKYCKLKKSYFKPITKYIKIQKKNKIAK